MHELSIAQSIIETIKQYVPEERLPDVSSVTVKVGDMSGVIADSLEFSFSALIAESELRNAKLAIQKIPFVLCCNDCNSTVQNEFGVAVCSNCGSINTKVVSGSELQVVDIELEDVVTQ